MGTRSLTVVNDQDGKEIICLYRQYDGHPTSAGEELKEFLVPFTMVNGLGGGKDAKVANGMGCLAAQLVAHFKTEPGGFYLYPPGTRDCGEEYIYTVYLKENDKKHGRDIGVLHLKVQAGAVTFFGMPGSKQGSMPVLYDGPVAEFDGADAEEVQAKLPPPKNDFIEEQEKKKAKAR